MIQCDMFRPLQKAIIEYFKILKGRMFTYKSMKYFQCVYVKIFSSIMSYFLKLYFHKGWNMSHCNTNDVTNVLVIDCPILYCSLHTHTHTRARARTHTHSPV
jgi:hypothetical protein